MGGYRFSSVDWSGTLENEVIGSLDVKGVLYILREGDIVYQLNFIDRALHADESIHEAKAVFRHGFVCCCDS